MASAINGAGETTLYRHDILGNLVWSDSPSSAPTSATWDTKDRRLSATDAFGNTARWAYDSYGRLSMAGCATPTAPGGENSGTTLDVFIQNDVPGAATLKGSFVYAYADANCAQPVALGRKIMMKDMDQHSTFNIPAGKPFTASVQTGWTRFGVGGNDFCTVTATFTPQANSSYRALLKLDETASKCELQIADQNDREVAYQAPAYSCDQTMGTVKNGISGFRRVRVVPNPVYLRSK